MPPSKHKEKSTGEILFQFSKKVESDVKPEKMKLEMFQVIKPGIGEKILCVQRRHPIALINSIIGQLFLIISLILLAFFTTTLLKGFIPINFTDLVILSYIIVSIVCVFAVSSIYIFMNWYYEFYIITNKSILHRRCFRIAGFYSDIIYLDKLHIREITRAPANLLYDFLKIENVGVFFKKHEQEEPFIFKTPNDAQAIEDLVHDIAILKEKSPQI